MDKNVVLLTNIIHPCRIPVLNYFRELNPRFKVFYMGQTHSNRSWDIIKDQIHYEFEILKGLNCFYQRLDWGVYINYGLMPRLIKGNFDVIISEGYDLPSYFFALAYAKLFKKKFVLWSGSTLLSRRVKNPIIDGLKRAFIRNADTYISYGSLAKECLVHYGAKESKIVVSCNTVDVQWFAQRKAELDNHKEEIKIQRGFPQHIVLFSGQLVKRKGLTTLLKAFEKIDNEDLGLVVVGDGPERSKYEDFVRRKGLKNFYFEGNQNREKLCEYYTIADIFVLPSFIEVWGLVVNEAMACELPVLCSSMAGAARDLVREGINGYTFDPHNSDELTDKLILLLNDEGLRKKMGEQSKKIISQFTPERYAKDLYKALEIAFEGG